MLVGEMFKLFRGSLLKTTEHQMEHQVVDGLFADFELG
jgi:hypothetical protein